MERNEFHLKSFSLKDKQDIEAEYKHDGKIVKEEFTEAVSVGLFKALEAFDEVVKKRCGIKTDAKTTKVTGIETRKVHLFDGSEESSMMVTVIKEWTGGYKSSENVVKMLLSAWREHSGIDCEPLVEELEDRVFALLFEGEVGHEQGKLL